MHSLSNSLDFEILKNPSEFEKIRKDWEILQWNPYYDIDYLIFKYNEIETDVEPHIIVLKSDGKLKAIIVGEIKGIPIRFQIGYKVWYGPKLKTLVIPRYGVLGEANEGVWKIVEQIAQEMLISKRIEAVLFRGHELSSPVHRMRFSRLPKLCKLNKEIIQERWQIDCNGGLSLHKKNFKAFWKHIRNYKNRINRISEGEEEIICYDKLEKIDIFLKDAGYIERNTWQYQLGVSKLNSSEIRKKHSYLLNKNFLKGYILYIKKRPISFLCGIKYKNCFYAEIMGYDQKFRYEGVGTYLMGYFIEKYFNDGQIEIIDYDVGNSEAKKMFCNKFFVVGDKFAIAPVTRLIALNLSRGICLGLHIFLKKSLAKAGLYNKIRSLWRYKA